MMKFGARILMVFIMDKRGEMRKNMDWRGRKEVKTEGREERQMGRKGKMHERKESNGKFIDEQVEEMVNYIFF